MVSKSDHELVTKLIGENLLKGYTLLDQSCPECIAPLMKRKDEEAFCVYCRDVRPCKVVKREAVGESTQQECSLKPIGTASQVQEDLDHVINNLAQTARRYSTLINSATTIKTEDNLTSQLHSLLVTIEKAIEIRQLLSNHGPKG